MDELSPPPNGLATPSDLAAPAINEIGEHAAEQEALMAGDDNVEEYFQAAQDVQGVIDQIEQHDDGQGLSGQEAQVLEIAVENFTYRLQLNKTPRLAFEDFTTRRSKLKNRQLALEGFKETLVKIWRKIVEFLRENFQRFKKFFSFHRVEVQVAKQRTSHLDEVLRQAHKTPPKIKTFVDAQLHAILTTRRGYATGTALMSNVEYHLSEIRFKETRFAHQDPLFVKMLTQAINGIAWGKGQTFWDGAEWVLRELYAKESLAKAVAGTNSGEMVEALLFELPLTFGNKSYFKTTAPQNSAMHRPWSGAFQSGSPTSLPFQSYVGQSSSKIFNEDHSAPIDTLSLAECERLNHLIKERWKARERFVAELEGQDRAMINLVNGMAAMDAFPDSKVEWEVNACRVLTQLVHNYATLRKSMLGDWLNYDKRVLNALLTWTEKSLKLSQPETQAA